MADLDWIDICPQCFVPVEGCRKCPQCGEKLKRIASLGFEMMRILRDKGWKPIEFKLTGYGKNRGVSVVFDGQSPGRGVHGEMRCQLTEEGLPVCTTWRERGSVGSYREAYEWAQEASTFRNNFPFNRSLCEMCTEQFDANWLHGNCMCPETEPDVMSDGKALREFARGLPDRCLYLVEQTITRPERERELGL